MKQIEIINGNDTVDIFMDKWLASFIDEDLAKWEMPYKTEGFYNAWKLLVVYDADTGKTALKNIPKTSITAL